MTGEGEGLFPEADLPPPPAGAVPLAERVRPATLDEFEGQDAVLGPATPLRRAIEAGRPPSLILWGPPGSGKTTLARIIARSARAEVVSLSAVAAGVADVRQAVDAARRRQRLGQRTLLFIDEIHRFSRSQQDVLLPHVESGLLLLVGATTENPGFSLTGALLSRCTVVQLSPLDDAAMDRVIERALTRAQGLLPLRVSLTAGARQLLREQAAGDARAALSTLEFAAEATDPGSDGRRVVDMDQVAAALFKPPRLDRQGDLHYQVISAFIKSIRGSDPDAALYWLARLLTAGEDPMFVVRRMVILAAEDVGLADPAALPLAVACQQAVHFVGLPEGYLPMAECAIYLSLAPKSNSALTAYERARQDVEATPTEPVPLHLRNAVTRLDRALGFGAGYRYAHDAPGGVAAQIHLPAALAGHRYYEPGDRGFEASLRQRLEEIRRRLGAQGAP